MIIANPIYDSVFKYLMADIEVAKGIISALIGMKVVELKCVPQEHVRKDVSTGELLGMRFDFNAVVETKDRGRFNVIIELQKAPLGSNALRFRNYLASQYQSVEHYNDLETGRDGMRALPIISIYLLGYTLSSELPMATHVTREYRNAVTGDALACSEVNEFIELLTHDAYFIQIPLIKGAKGTELERVLSVFDQHHQLEKDKHRLEVTGKPVNSDPLIAKIYRILKKAQEDPEIEKAMTLEDIFLLEQQDAAADERKLREQAEAKLAAAEAEVQEADRKREDADRKREDAERKREEEARKREKAEAEIERLKSLLDDK